jgi:hypothetical protein
MARTRNKKEMKTKLSLAITELEQALDEWKVLESKKPKSKAESEPQSPPPAPELPTALFQELKRQLETFE